jgi:3-oxoacyl-[acyl-carrier-protein] synthase II
MSDREVVVTGVGAVTSIGIGAEGLWAGVMRAESAVRRVTRFDPSPFRTQVAAEVRDFDPYQYMDAKRVKRLDRFAQFSLASALMALGDAGLVPGSDGLEPNRAGVLMGSALGGVALAEEQHERFLKEGLRAVDPTLALAVYGGASSCNIAIDLGWSGPNSTNANSCASGTMAISEALELIRCGRLDAALAGGAECPLAPLSYGAFAHIRAMSTRNDDPETACRPFDRERDGFVMGEGAAVLMLEEKGRARERGARIYCELRGSARTCDAHNMIAPLPTAEQSSRCMRMALDDARMNPDKIDALNAHGSSTPLNDKTETLAIKKVFGERAARIPVSATKSMHAHALGASGAIEAAISCLAFAHRTVPATIHRENPDPECDLDYVTDGPREQRITGLLSNSFGFGGINACLVFRGV